MKIKYSIERHIKSDLDTEKFRYPEVHFLEAHWVIALTKALNYNPSNNELTTDLTIVSSQVDV